MHTCVVGSKYSVILLDPSSYSKHLAWYMIRMVTMYLMIFLQCHLFAFDMTLISFYFTGCSVP